MAIVEEEMVDLEEVDYAALEEELRWIKMVVRHLPEGLSLEVGGVMLSREAIELELRRMIGLLRAADEATLVYNAAADLCRKYFASSRCPRA